MATRVDQKEFDLQEQLARIRKFQEQSDKFSAETRKLIAEAKTISIVAVFQGAIAIAALLGAGAAIAKLFFP